MARAAGGGALPACLPRGPFSTAGTAPRLAGNRHRTRISPTTLELFYMKLFFVAPFTAA